MEECIMLVAEGKKLGMKIIGVSFHVGVECKVAEPFTTCIQQAKKIFDFAASIQCPMSLVDLGGGWPGDPDTSAFEKIAREVNSTLEELFPPNVKVISEPGTFFTYECQTYFLHIHSAHAIYKPSEKEQVSEISTYSSVLEAILADREIERIGYYVDDGVYGSFFESLYKSKIPVFLLRPEEITTKEVYPSIIYGPTACLTDIVIPHVLLPKLRLGDTIYIKEWGAYSSAFAGSCFNGIPLPQNYNIWDWKSLEGYQNTEDAQIYSDIISGYLNCDRNSNIA